MNRTTINKQEVNKFSKIADEWWDTEGKFKPLHIKSNLQQHFKINNKLKPLNNLEILDIGCGGGLLSEPIARLGAKVVGIDASEKNIKIAKSHLKKSKLNIDYINSSPEDFKTKKNLM